MVLLGYLSGAAYGAVCLLIALIAYRLGLPKKYTRKIVHVLVGFEWVILNAFFGSSVHFLIVCLGFTLMLLVSYGRRLLPMISSENENAPGTVYYGVSMSVMALACLFLPELSGSFAVAVFVTSFGDGLAGVVGSSVRRSNPEIYRKKTLLGTLACAVFSFVSAVLVNFSLSLGLSWWVLGSLAVLAAGIELISVRGLDNILLPLGVFGFLVLAHYGSLAEYIAPILLTPIIIVIVSKKKILTSDGIIAAILLDVVVSIAFGNFGFVYLLAFLLLTAVVDKLKHRLKYGADRESHGSDHRCSAQVMANGAVPLMLSIFYLVFPSPILVLLYVTALAECFADSVASGVGVLSPRAYDVIRMKRIPVGLSGGVSVPGTVAAALAAAALPFIALAFGAITLREYPIAILAAFLGTLADSVLGSLLQVKYKCKKCAALTEREEHCGAPTEKASGLSFIDNDMVNVISTSVSVILAFAISLLI